PAYTRHRLDGRYGDEVTGKDGQIDALLVHHFHRLVNRHRREVLVVVKIAQVSNREAVKGPGKTAERDFRSHDAGEIGFEKRIAPRHHARSANGSGVQEPPAAHFSCYGQGSVRRVRGLEILPDVSGGQVWLLTMWNIDTQIEHENYDCHVYRQHRG